MRLLSKLVLLVSAAIGVAALASASPVRLPLTREYLVNTVSAELAAHFKLEGELQLELVRAWSPPDQTAERWTIALVDYPTVATQSMVLRCRIQGDAAVPSDHVLVVKAVLWRDAWAARQPLTIGAPFDPALLEVRRVDAMRERDALPASVGDRSNVFARGVSAGRVLTWRDISQRPLVRKGELVDVSAVDGTLAVVVKALAMENGARGETITLRNPESRKDFPAIVVDEKRVQVRF